MKFKSQILTQASGSVGGLTFSHNSAGMYTRARSIPVNPNTDRQQQARNVFSSLAGLWSSTLNPAERTAWNLYGATVPLSDVFGDPLFVSGLNQYQRSNAAILTGGLPRVDSGPTTMSLPDTDPAFDPTVDEANQEISVVYDDGLPWADLDDAGMMIYMSSPVSVGREFMSPHKRFAGTILGDAITPLTSPQLIPVPFAVAEDQKVEVLARIVLPDGRASTLFRATVSVTA